MLPGGGYRKLSAREGYGYAKWLQTHGVACFVLKYRLGSSGYHYPAMYNDIARAARTVRANAARWGIAPGRIGVMGSSAGGHLASLLVGRHDAGDASHADPVEHISSRPDLAVLVYPVITMGKHTHAGSKKMLLGDTPSNALVEETSSERHVTKGAFFVGRCVCVSCARTCACACASAGLPVDG